MNEIIILTQPSCPNCDKLKMFFKFGLKGKYNDIIKEVSKYENEDIFRELINNYEITSTPAIIINDQVLKDTQPSKVKEFIQMWENQ